MNPFEKISVAYLDPVEQNRIIPFMTSLSESAKTPAPADELHNLRVRVFEQSEKIRSLENQLAWFKKQIFGQKSEQRDYLDNPCQSTIADFLVDLPLPEKPQKEEKTPVSYERGKAKKNVLEGSPDDSGLRFDPSVPVEEILLPSPELEGKDRDQYELIRYEHTYRLAQTPSSYVVLKYLRPVIRRKEMNETGKPEGQENRGQNDNQTEGKNEERKAGEGKANIASRPEVITTPAPANVLEKSLADVTLLVGLLLDKFLYHLPLYRQHQRMSDAGILLARSTLTNLVRRAIDLLRPVYEAQLDNVLLSKVLAIDETWIKAGRKEKGKMQQAYFWPVYGEQNEICFTFSLTRGVSHLKSLLEGYSGTILSDGYKAYECYTARLEELTHALCWVHSRRQFVEAEKHEPEAVAVALEHIGRLYKIEQEIRERKLDGTAKRSYRQKHSKEVVDSFFVWCHEQRQNADLLPSNPLGKALGYVQKREHGLRIFLEDPAVPMDTNHVERGLRCIPMGRKNWMFCWTEVGAEQAGMIQSLLMTCRLHDINPCEYLVDVLQRVDRHPASKVHELTPREWKTRFADNPLRSDLYARMYSVITD